MGLQAMKITRIAEQEKLKGRYSVFVDGKYSFSLSEGALLASKLAIGQDLDASEIKRWKQESADDKIYGNALRYAAMRMRSSWEMEQYLKRKGAPPALADKVINKLTNIDLLDDQKFARAWVANRRLLRPTSKRKLQQELRAKHVSDEVIELALLQEDGNELDSLREIVAKKRNLPKYQADPVKLMQYLARQGFNYDDIKAALKGIPED